MFHAPIQTLHFLHKRNRSLPRYIVCNAVLAIASPSDKCVNCDKTKEIAAHINIPYKRSIHLVVSDIKNIWWACPILPEMLGQKDPPPSKGIKNAK